MRYRIVVPVLMVACLALTGRWGVADDGAKGTEIIEQAMAAAAALDSVSVSVHMAQHTEINGRVNDVEMGAELALRGEKDAFVRITAPQEEAQVFSDGEKRFVYFVTKEEYMEAAAPEKRSEIVSLMGGGPIQLGSMWIGDFLHNNSKLTGEAESIVYGGLEKAPGAADGPDCHLVKLAYAGFDISVWLSAEGVVVPTYFKIDASKSFAQAGLDRKVDVMFTFSDWKFNQDLGDERFAFVAPEGVEKVDPSAPRTASAGNSKIGDPAPALKLPLLDGGTVDLADHKGKDIVILDFWASWCGPCRVGLPAVAEVVDKFADRGVVFYGVNLREDEQTIRSFFTSVKTEFPVLMDKSGDVGFNYGATSIPRTVIIDKDGNIAEVHAGFSAGMKKQIEDKLTELLAS